MCARDFAPYEGLTESVFAQYGVPVFLSTVTDVLQKPVLALVTSALAAAAGDYPYEELFRYLKTGLAGISEDERDELENYVLTWDIKGGTWTRQKPWDMHPEGYGREFSDEDTALVERLDGLRRRVIAPLETLRRSPDRTGHGRALALYRLMEDIDLPARLEERAASLEDRGDLKTAAEYCQLWDILAGALEQCALLLGDVELELEEFSRLFSLALSQYDVGTIPVSLDRAAAGDAPRMAGRTVKALFLLGADSVSIPSCAPSPGLFSDLDREALAERELRLAPRQGDKLQRELTIAYETCALPTERLYMSYAAADGAGSARAPSFLYERIAALFPDSPERKADETCRLAAPGPALELAGENAAAADALSALPGWGERVARIRSAARWRRGRLTPAGVSALYGGTVPMSATRLDLYNACRFSHFMKFGLSAKPRQKAKFRPSDYGTFIHAVLEEVLGKATAMPGGIRALAADPVLRHTLTAQAADRYEAEALAGLEGETARFHYVFDRMKQSAQTVADSVCGELAASDFTPVYFELGFGRGQAMPPLEVEKGVKLRTHRLCGPGGQLGEGREALPPGGGLQDRQKILRLFRCGRRTGPSDAAVPLCPPAGGAGPLRPGGADPRRGAVRPGPQPHHQRRPGHDGRGHLRRPAAGAAAEGAGAGGRGGAVRHGAHRRSLRLSAHLPRPGEGRLPRDAGADGRAGRLPYPGAGGGGGAARGGQHRRRPLLAQCGYERLPLLRLRRRLSLRGVLRRPGPAAEGPVRRRILAAAEKKGGRERWPLS